jgi:hypothetical protein
MNRSQLAATAFALGAAFGTSACSDNGRSAQLATFDSALSQDLQRGHSVEFDLESQGVHVRQTSSSVTCTGPNGRSVTLQENPVFLEVHMDGGVVKPLPYDLKDVDQAAIGYCAGVLEQDDLINFRVG